MYKNMYKCTKISEIIKTLKRTHKLKSHWLDKITNLRHHNFSFTHQLRRKLISEIIKEHEKCLISSQNDEHTNFQKQKTQEIQNYRSITNLPTIYKMIISILKERIVKYIECNYHFRSEQKGCKKERIIWLQRSVPRKQDNRGELSIQIERFKYGMDWLQKAFDRIHYKRILKVLNIFKISPVIITFLKYNAKRWHINLRLIHEKGILETNNLKSDNEIFQGNSPPLFCIALIPLP